MKKKERVRYGWEKIIHRHTENRREMRDAPINNARSLCFDVGDDVTSDATATQLHSGYEDVLRPVLLHA